MKYDWAAIRHEYVSGGSSYRDLAEKYHINPSTLMKHGADEKWVEQKAERERAVSAKTEQLIIEKTADNLSEVAAIQSRVKLKLMKMIEDALPTIEEEDTDRLRKVVSAYKDMCEIAADTKDEESGGGVIEIPAVIGDE